MNERREAAIGLIGLRMVQAELFRAQPLDDFSVGPQQPVCGAVKELAFRDATSRYQSKKVKRG